MIIILSVFHLIIVSEITAQTTNCGIQAVNPHTSPARATRVVGGQESIPHSWPWMVVLRHGTNKIDCVGALVRGSDDALVVVTAGHCIDRLLTSTDWKIDVGVSSRSGAQINQKEYGVSSLVVHHDFSPQFLDNDIGIVKPSSPILENEHVRPICISINDPNTMVGKECVIAGWGSIHQGGPTVDTLHEVYKPILNDSECYINLAGLGFDEDGMFCAGNLTHGGVDSCSWDSGSPFACKRYDGHWEMVGISSWGFGCAQPGYPGVYTEVFKFVQWIKDNSHTNGGLPADNSTIYRLSESHDMDRETDSQSIACPQGQPYIVILPYTEWDSGAPFACKRSDGHWEMVGISSWGYGCAQPEYPGVYTEVFKFAQWIKDNFHTNGGHPAVG